MQYYKNSPTSQIKTWNVHFRDTSLMVSRTNQQATKVSRDICLAIPLLALMLSVLFPSLPSHGVTPHCSTAGQGQQAERRTQGNLLPLFLRKLSFSRWQMLICWDKKHFLEACWLLLNLFWMLLPRVKSSLPAKVRDQLRRPETSFHLPQGPSNHWANIFLQCEQKQSCPWDTSSEEWASGGCPSMSRSPRCTFAPDLCLKDSDLYSFHLFGFLSSWVAAFNFILLLTKLWKTFGFPKCWKLLVCKARDCNYNKHFSFWLHFPYYQMSYSLSTETEGALASRVMQHLERMQWTSAQGSVPIQAVRALRWQKKISNCDQPGHTSSLQAVICNIPI